MLLGNDDKIQAAVGKLDSLTRSEASLVGVETLTETKRTGRTVDNISIALTTTNTSVLETGVAVRQMSLGVV